jgi:hypothetical protein
MADELETLMPADAADRADKLAFALQFKTNNRKRVHDAAGSWRG